MNTMAVARFNNLPAWEPQAICPTRVTRDSIKLFQAWGGVVHAPATVCRFCLPDFQFGIRNDMQPDRPWGRCEILCSAEGTGICNCARTNDPACAVNAFDNCQTWPHDKDKEKKIRDNKNACEDQFPGSTLKNAKLYQGLCVE